MFSRFRAIFFILFWLNFHGKGNAMAVRLQFPPVAVTIDPHSMEEAFSMFLVAQVHRGLFRYNPVGEVLPDLVDSWSLSPDRLTYVFRLKNAKFSDGSPVKAENVRHSFARLFARGGSIGADLEAISGVRSFRKSKNISEIGIKVLDERTVEFKLTSPSSIFLKQLAAADCAILKTNSFSADYNIDAGTPVSGPYRIASQTKQHIILEKWRTDLLDSEKPPLRIEVKFTSDDPVKAAIEGNSDVLDREVVQEQDLKRLLQLSWKKVATEVVMERFVILNPERIPLELRQLMFSLVDQKALTASLSEPSLVPAYGLIPFGMPGSLTEADLHALKKKVANSKTGILKITMPYPADSRLAERMVFWLKETWEKSGIIEVKPQPKSAADVLDAIFSKNTDAIIAGKALDYFEGYSVLSYFRSDYDSNHFHASSPAIDRLLDEAIHTESQTKRLEIYKKTQLEILSHYSIIPLTFGSLAAGLWGPRISYVPAHPGGLHTLPLETVKMK